jgi:hypothetical protein
LPRPDTSMVTPSPHVPTAGPGIVVLQPTYQVGSVGVLVDMTRNDDPQPGAGDGRPPGEASPPLVIATILRGEGHTGVQTHVHQLRL